MTTTRKTVLVADDERRWREFACNLLADTYQVETARDCESALARVREGGVDLLVVDFLMPGEEPFGTGFDVALHLRQQKPGLPIILYTGAWEGMAADRQEIERKARGTTVVFKDVRDPQLDDLPARVQALLN